MNLSEEAKQARQKYMQDYKKRNSEKEREYQRKWRKNNPEKIREYNRRYWERKAANDASDDK